MSRLRRTIALRLKESQNTAAQLTTFNEVDMSHVMKLRTEYKDSFEKKHGVRLGFMGFFVKACIAALKELAQRQRRDRGRRHRLQELLRHGRGRSRPTKVSSSPWCAMPTRFRLPESRRRSTISAARARDNKLKLDELQGGTFTISNGGVFGSLMSTPILNTPQSGILGMHKIQPRPVAVGDKIEIRPMMYLRSPTITAWSTAAKRSRSWCG
jgi:2-oxoglutarate dehydrogenase E2 component (dihydrolipoamide succinyltransferase)